VACLHKEVLVMKQLQHPNIVTLIDFVSEDQHFYIVMEYLAYGDLFNKLAASVAFSEKQARDAMRALLRGVKHMHDQNIAHRDLKPENIMLASDPSGGDVNHEYSDIKIGDFGFAKWREGGKMMETRLGSPSYVAPEILQGQSYSKAVDMWSIGIIMFIMLGGYMVSHMQSAAYIWCDLV
jgi:serine/threonine protein kinase